ncbi:hypothetical protein A3D85_01275 [Candidatus Amesbacteria bacterium RIFCSPHIGHO2_02_FULL_47_9]|uniref:Carrier domain-containing protein n=1 Tax=Candidatus Amesbacteria bacterium RIFCSPHIGHO2_01_FULL_48_32b TaxID=1797253 RepID=A0A1F4YGH0_9BACT|nr:MAG: hypothetical protein A2876_01575 [Candidatus Amesbacteria bacterium RIFCSPHIGHO2_01_FULL_48_32b]OGD04241.1 MAG: hypothetical protein A3D85_01275 [Candidatus Amesbacteria bacterium RIFCSPHIGHO2_02_FULL_47_9]OGD07341.1 MAG: hypothetical protein A2899_01335 [Candidatus Amesbacteria bacterium RIFCSPLOWO2_01_FULL_49_25]
MNNNLNKAIIQFLANEFKMNPENLTPDLSFSSDLGLSPQEIQELLQRLQDALNFILPEERTGINTISDLLGLTEEEPEVE